MRWGSNATDGFVDFRTSLDQMRTDIRDTKKAADQAIEEFRDVYQITEDQMLDAILGRDGGSGDDNTSGDPTRLSKIISDIQSKTKDLESLQIQSINLTSCYRYL